MNSIPDLNARIMLKYSTKQTSKNLLASSKRSQLPPKSENEGHKE